MINTALPLYGPEGITLGNPVALSFQGNKLFLARATGQQMTLLYYKVRNAQALPGAANE